MNLFSMKIFHIFFLLEEVEEIHVREKIAEAGQTMGETAIVRRSITGKGTVMMILEEAAEAQEVITEGEAKRKVANLVSIEIIAPPKGLVEAGDAAEITKENRETITPVVDSFQSSLFRALQKVVKSLPVFSPLSIFSSTIPVLAVVI